MKIMTKTHINKIGGKEEEEEEQQQEGLTKV